MAGYSGKSLIDKLGLKPGMTAYFDNLPSEYLSWIGNLDGVKVKKALTNHVDFIQTFFLSKVELKDDLPRIVKHLAPNSMWWVSWPKKSSNIQSDLTENDLRSIVLPTGLVDIKVAAISDDWSGLKFVWRKDRR